MDKQELELAIDLIPKFKIPSTENKLQRLFHSAGLENASLHDMAIGYLDSGSKITQSPRSSYTISTFDITVLIRASFENQHGRMVSLLAA
ncbi:hypothetical protein BJX76DRAFT_118081 [Aspergillus varians]